MPRTPPDNLYSRFVAWVKILLPLAALALLASLFLVARRPGEPVLPFADIDLAELARDRGIAGPHYTGVTEEGHAVSVTADRATPRLADRRLVDATAIRLDLDTAEGRRIRLDAGRGVIDTARQEADLAGGVAIQTASGHRLETARMTASLDRTEMQTDAPVTLTGPNIRADAGGMAVRPSVTDAERVIVHFKNGVVLVYTPPQD